MASAQVDTSLVIETVEINSNRINFNSKEWGRSVKVLDKKMLETLPAQSLAEVLQTVAGLDVRRRGPNNVQSDISMRGGSFDQVLILINGVRMNDAQTGHHSLYLPIDLESIERIEIVRGPAAKLYGQNAFSGAINVVTKPGQEDRFRASISYGSFNTLGLNASYGKTLYDGKWQQQLSFSAETSDGYDYNRDYQIFNYFYDSKLKFSETDQLLIFGGYSERNFGANGFYALPTFKDQYEEVQTSIASIKWSHHKENWKVVPGISWRRNDDNYLFVRDNPSVFQNHTLGNRLTADVHVSNYNKLGVLGVGAEYSQEYLRSWRLGDHDRSVLGFYLEEKFSLLSDRLVLSPGIYFNKYSQTPLQVLPGIDVSYFVARNTKVYASVNSANRLPTYTDLYYSSAVEQGNPLLKSEKVLGYEVGLQHETKSVSAGASAYLNYTNGLIDWTKSSETDAKWVTNNYAATIISGLEANVDIKFHNLLSLSNLLDFNLSSSFISAESNEKDNVYLTRYQFNHLGQQWIARLGLGLWHNKLYANIMYRGINRVVSDIDPSSGDDLFDYQLMDVTLKANWKTLQIKLMCNNLFNTTYKELGNVVMPGRWFDLKLSYTLVKK